MNGYVDDDRRALLDISISNQFRGSSKVVTCWIDTAFDGHLVLSAALIEELDVESLAETEAILADGSKVLLETFVSYVDWFGARTPVQVIANDGKYPLLGTGLLAERVLQIDYAAKWLSLL